MLCYFNVRYFNLKIFPKGFWCKHILLHTIWQLDGKSNFSVILKSKGCKEELAVPSALTPHNLTSNLSDTQTETVNSLPYQN
jgi:hypothetical protein